MSHFTVLVKATNEDELFQRLIPFKELGCGDYELDVHLQPYLEWENVEDEHRKKYETDSITMYRVEDERGGLRLVTFFDEQFRTKPFGLGSDTHDVPDGTPAIDIPLKVLYPTFDDYMEYYAEYSKDGHDTYGYLHNPNQKWDYYQIGGRWNGILQLKSGDKVNVALWRDVDIEAICSKNAQVAQNAWDTVETILKPFGITPAEYCQLDRERIQEIRSGLKDSDDPWALIDFRCYGQTRAEHITNAQRRALTFALVDENGWLERARMGWWAITTDNNDTYDQQYWERIETYAPEDRVYIVDCHI